jgi:hypothetical protein
LLRWNQTLELRLPGGKIGERGFFVNDSASTSKLRMDVYDAQVKGGGGVRAAQACAGKKLVKHAHARADGEEACLAYRSHTADKSS